MLNGSTLVYEDYNPESEGLREALCTLGNGYLCTRGAAPDCPDDDVHYPGVYIAGLYNRAVSLVEGRDVENEDLVNLPNWLRLTVRIDGGEWVRLDEMEILDFRQELCVRTGVLSRQLRLRDRAGRTTGWRERRIVSMADKHLAAIKLEIEAQDWSGRLDVTSALDGGVINNNVPRYRGLESRHLETLETGVAGEDIIDLKTRTRQSRIVVAEAARTRVFRDGEPAEISRRVVERADWIAHELSLDMARGERVRIEKVVAIFTSLDPAISEPGLAARESVSAAPGFEALLTAHCAVWASLWSDFDVAVEMRPIHDTETKLRLHIFHLLQTVSRHSIDADAGVPARGWHGESYRGHIFWDEIFILPFLNLRAPVISRALLKYRYRRLGAAKRNAQAEGFEGALYPWQSGSDGREETQVLHLNPNSGQWKPDNSRRQRHVNAAIAYNIWRYYEVTGDREFMLEYGAEMYLEIARFWASIATWREKDQRYEIRDVMGPDEFQTADPGVAVEDERGIANNAYTNVMASFVLRHALDVMDLLPPDARTALCARSGVCEDDLVRWDDISRRLFVPFHADGIFSQFEGYEDLKEFDWKGYREKYGDIQRLDRILHAEGDTPNNYKASKQADALMLFYLFSAEELALLFERLGYRFDVETIPRTIDYYLSRTAHGSTLSHIVHSWVLARSDRPMSWDLLRHALDVDIADIQGGTTQEGIHLGAMAGVVDLFQRCLTGLEIRGGIIYLNPSLPEGLDRLCVRINYRGHCLRITVVPDVVTIDSALTTAAPIMIAYRGHFRELSPGGSASFRIIARRPRLVDIQEDSRRELRGNGT